MTVYVHHGNRILGQHRFEFISRSDSLHRLFYEALDPISFMCEALQISPPEVHELDKSLALTFKAKAPNGFSFLDTQHVEVTGKYPPVYSQWFQYYDKKKDIAFFTH